MYVPKELKLNDFVDVKIPSNKDYFARLGKQQLGVEQYTGDDAATLPQSKIDQIIAGEFALEREMRDAESSE